jgi:hypothetical protein
MDMSKDDMLLPGVDPGAQAYRTVANKPVVFPPREDQVRRNDDAFYARLAKAYDTVKITAQPVPSTGERRSDIERPEIAADEARIRLSRHFPEGPGVAKIAQQSASRYSKALTTYLEKEGGRRPNKPELARRWGMFCRDHANAEREYFQAGYRPALIDPTAFDFSTVKVTERERKAVNKARGTIRHERADERDR